MGHKYVINLDEYKLIETHWVALYVNGNNESLSYNATYFGSFGVEQILTEIKQSIGNKNIITNKCVDTFVLDYMFEGKNLSK